MFYSSRLPAPHPWQEFNAVGNTCQVPGCALAEDAHPAPASSPEPRFRRTWPGMFVVVTGGEGAGKSTQVRQLVETLKDRYGLAVVQTREPGGVNVDAKIRTMLLNDETLSDRAEALLYAADRALHMQAVVPFLEQGWIVVSDRHAESSIAYQGAGRGLDEDWIRMLSAWAAPGVVPDLTVLLDVPPQVGLDRARDRPGGQWTRFEELGADFHERVHQSLRGQAKSPSWEVVPGSGTVEEVAALVEAAVVARLTPQAGVVR